MINEPHFETGMCVGPKVWRAELASAVGASNFLDFLVLLRHGKSTMKNKSIIGNLLSGNITHKSDIGVYTYGDAGPHAVTGLSNTKGSLLPSVSL